MLRAGEGAAVPAKDSIKPGIISRNLLETRYKWISRWHLLTDDGPHCNITL